MRAVLPKELICSAAAAVAQYWPARYWQRLCRDRFLSGAVQSVKRIPEDDRSVTACSGAVRGLFSALFSRQQLASEPPQYPQRPFVYKLGHIDIHDNYRWLSDHEAARPYLQQEARYFDLVTRQWSHQARKILQELRQHAAAAQTDDLPEKVGPYYYFSTTNPHGPDMITRHNTATGQQEVVLSADIMQADADKITQLLGVPVDGGRLVNVKLSHDHQLLAYSLQIDDGTDTACCVARHTPRGALLQDCVLPSVSSFEWSADGSCLYYCTPDAQGRPSKVFRHMVGQQQPDQLLFNEVDPKHFVTLTRTKDWRYVLINSHSKLSSEVHILDAHDPHAQSVCIHPRSAGWEYFVEHHHGHLLILTNTTKGHSSTTSPAHSEDNQAEPDSSTANCTTQPDAVAETAARSLSNSCSVGDYCLVFMPAEQAGRSAAEAWQMLLPVQQGASVTDMDVFDSCVVLHESRNALPCLRILQLREHKQQNQAKTAATGTQQQQPLQEVEQRQVSLPEWAFAMRPGINQDYHSCHMRIYVSSPTTPEVPYDVDLLTGQLQPVEPQLQQTQQHGNNDCKLVTRSPSGMSTADSASSYRPSRQQNFICRRMFAPSHDGTQVPITLMHVHDMKYNARSPLLVEVYGAYGQVLEADYRPHRLPLIDRGWAIALAHVRGGGEGGRRWHAAGRQLHKPNSVADLLACLEMLTSMQVTSPGNIAGIAASAGGLTLAAAVNHNPQLFSSVVLEAPFVDWSGGMGDVGLPHLLTEHETDEWGDPNKQPPVADMIRAMCPYNNLQANEDYPAMLVTGGLQDTRVPFWMPVKYVAKLRSLQSCDPDMQDVSGRTLVGQEPGRPHDSSRPVLLHIVDGAGHFSIGHSGGSLEDIALQYAFLGAQTKSFFSEK